MQNNNLFLVLVKCHLAMVRNCGGSEMILVKPWFRIINLDSNSIDMNLTNCTINNCQVFSTLSGTISRASKFQFFWNIIVWKLSNCSWSCFTWLMRIWLSLRRFSFSDSKIEFRRSVFSKWAFLLCRLREALSRLRIIRCCRLNAFNSAPVSEEAIA